MECFLRQFYSSSFGWSKNKTGYYLSFRTPENIVANVIPPSYYYKKKINVYYNRYFGGSNRTGLFFLSTVASSFLSGAIKIKYKIIYLGFRINSFTFRKKNMFLHCTLSLIALIRSKLIHPSLSSIATK